MNSLKRLTAASVFLFGFALCLGASAKLAQADGFMFYRTLSLGSSGEDVRQLQIVLNSDPVTRIEDAGPGSPGQETGYFGALTQAAVIRFQDKYYSQILAPNGLSNGTGVVGPSTRLALDSLGASTAPSTAAATMPSTKLSAATAPLAATSTIPGVTATNPNLKNLGIFLADVEKVSAEKGVSPAQVAIIEAQIKKDIATTTDLKQKFIDEVIQSNASAYVPATHTLFDSIISGANAVLAKIFKPTPAMAQTTGTPFGGALLYSYYCDCSNSWLIGVEPLPPAFPALLTYEEGTQVFLNYNIPFTTELLGSYTSGSGICEEYIGTGCASIDSEGLISPMTGSAL